MPEINDIADVFSHFGLGELLAAFLAGRPPEALLAELEGLFLTNSEPDTNDEESRERYGLLAELVAQTRASYREAFGWELDIPGEDREAILSADRGLDKDNDQRLMRLAQKYLFSNNQDARLREVRLVEVDILYLPIARMTPARRRVVGEIYAEWNRKLGSEHFRLP